MMGQSDSVFVTGGSGLLGSQVVKYLRNAGFKVVAPAHVELDLADFEKLNRFLHDFKPMHIVNCAAQRHPEVCECGDAIAYALNVQLPNVLAKYGVPLLHISTDYVFNGANAPYREYDRRQPLNVYGRQKAAAEVALEAYEYCVILRVPILFGPTSNWANSAVTVLAKNLLDAHGAGVLIDDTAIRYPTYTCDVARQIVALLPGVGTRFKHIYHYSADEPMTKLMMGMSMASIVGCEIAQCIPNRVSPSVPRPYDCHLCTHRLRRTGCFIDPTPFASAIIQTLSNLLLP